jgi:hypothetical protein
MASGLNGRNKRIPPRFCRAEVLRMLQGSLQYFRCQGDLRIILQPSLFQLNAILNAGFAVHRKACVLLISPSIT